VRPARPDTERLFIGVPLPAAAVALVRAAQEALPADQGLRLESPEQTHVTLAFIGEAPVEAREAARAVVAGLPQEVGGVTTLGGYLFLPSARRPRVVALVVNDPGAVFSQLFELVMAGLERAHVMRREKRPYRPHVTIARLRSPTDVRPKSECGRASFPVESVCLYRSELRREGAVYTIMEERTLVFRNTIKQT
jgi:2''-5'' RNA ligase